MVQRDVVIDDTALQVIRDEPDSRSWIARFGRAIDGGLASVAIYPFLFATYSVMQLYANNVGEVPLQDALNALVIVLVLTAIAFWIVARIFGDARRAALPVGIAVVVVLGFRFVRDGLAPHVPIDGLILLGACLLAIVLVGIAARKATMISPITQAMNVTSLLLVAVALVPVLSFTSDTMRTPGGFALATLPAVATTPAAGVAHSRQPRDIYFLVMDRYGSERSLASGMGIDNSEFTAWLKDHGFQVVDDAHANFVRSSLSIASTLSMSMLDGIVDRIGPDSRDFAPVIDLIRNSRAAAFLQDQGYEYVHVGSWFGPTRDSDSADRSLAPESHFDLASAIVDNSAVRGLTDALGLGVSFAEMHARSAEYQLGVLHDLATQPGPKIVIAHVLLPHDPYVYLADGTFAPDRSTFESQLQYTNTQLKELLTPLLELPEDERPIIIMQGDEGPYPERYSLEGDAFDWATATDQEVATKFGILNAMYLPGPEGEAALPSTLSSVNTFREVLRRYFDADLPNLPDRSFGSPYARPYYLTEAAS